MGVPAPALYVPASRANDAFVEQLGASNAAMHLEELNLSQCVAITNDALVHLSRFPRLWVLSVSGCPHIDGESGGVISHACPQLRSLDVSNNCAINDKFLASVVLPGDDSTSRGLAELELLDLQRTRVTAAGLAQFIRRRAGTQRALTVKLESIDCLKLAPDVLRLARSANSASVDLFQAILPASELTFAPCEHGDELVDELESPYQRLLSPDTAELKLFSSNPSSQRADQARDVLRKASRVSRLQLCPTLMDYSLSGVLAQFQCLNKLALCRTVPVHRLDLGWTSPLDHSGALSSLSALSLSSVGLNCRTLAEIERLPGLTSLSITRIPISLSDDDASAIARVIGDVIGSLSRLCKLKLGPWNISGGHANLEIGLVVRRPRLRTLSVIGKTFNVLAVECPSLTRCSLLDCWHPDSNAVGDDHLVSFHDPAFVARLPRMRRFHLRHSEVPATFVERALRQWPRLTHLDLRGFAIVDMPLAAAFAHGGHALTSLHLSDWDLRGEFAAFHALVARCTRLEALSLRDAEGFRVEALESRCLRSLTIAFVYDLGSELRLPGLPNLERLSVDAFDVYSLHRLVITDKPRLVELRVPRSCGLREITVANAPLLCSVNVEAPLLDTLRVSGCPLLRSLAISHCERLCTLDGVECPSLRVLELQNMRHLKAAQARELVQQRFPLLDDLRVDNVSLK